MLQIRWIKKKEEKGRWGREEKGKEAGAEKKKEKEKQHSNKTRRRNGSYFFGTLGLSFH